MKPSTSLAFLSIVLLALGSGCGGGGDGPTEDELIYAFVTGDPAVQLLAAALIFADAGAPVDGQVAVLGQARRAELLATQEMEDLAFLVMFFITPHPLLLDVLAEIELDLDDQLDRTVTNRIGIPIVVPVVEDDDTASTFAGGVSPRIHADAWNGTLRSTAQVPRFGLVGGIDTKLRLTASLSFPGDGTTQATVRALSDMTPALGGATIQLLDGETVIAEGTLPLGGSATDVTLEGGFTDLRVSMSVRFLTLQDDFFEDILVDFDFTPLPPEPTVATVGDRVEGIFSMPIALWDSVYASEPLAAGQYATMLVGGHHIETGRIVGDAWLSSDASAQPVSSSDTTYRGAFVGSYTPGASAPGNLVAPPMIARLAVGSWGLSIANFDGSTGMFGPESVVDTGNMTDIAPFFGEIESGEAVYVDNTNDALKFITRDASDDYVIDPSATHTSAKWAGASGKVVSAFVHTSGDLLFVTDGDPGELWVLPPGAGTATKITDVGAAPRTVRTVGNIGVVGSFGGTGLSFGSLHFLVRSATGTWGRAPFSLTGARVIGIDVRQLSDGRVAVASTSYLTHELRIDVLDGDTGEVLKDELIPLPEGCTLPAHCAFVEGEDTVLVSCNGSGNVAVIPVSFEE